MVDSRGAGGVEVGKVVEWVTDRYLRLVRITSAMRTNTQERDDCIDHNDCSECND